MTPSKLTGVMIRAWRERIGLTRNELSEKLGISEGSLLNYEHGKRVDKPEAVKIPLLMDWALAAIHAKLKPFSETFGNKK